MFYKKILVLLMAVAVFGFAFGTQAQEATSTPEITAEGGTPPEAVATSTTTPEILPETEPELTAEGGTPPEAVAVATSTPETTTTSSESSTTTPEIITTNSESATSTPESTTPETTQQEPEPEVQVAPVVPIPEQQEQELIPDAPKVEPVVQFTSQNGKGFDPATAPSIVKIKIVDPNNEIPRSPVFITFVGVGGRTYGGQIDRYGELEVVMPTGRYYADVLVIDTQLGPPLQPPAFFLEANEKRDLGIFALSEKSLFADESLEREMANTIGKGDVSGFAKVFALVVKLLLSILQELRSVRSELLWR